MGEEVARLADWPHHVHDARLPFPGPHRHNLVISLVERGTDQVVHRRVGNHEGLPAVALDVEHAREKRAGLRDQEAPRLQQQTALEGAEGAFNGRGVFAHLGGGVEAARVVVDAQASAYIDGLEG